MARLVPQTEHLPSAVIFGCSFTSLPQSPHFGIKSPPSRLLSTISNVLANKKLCDARAKQRSYISIDGTGVKSKAEKEIMDCLLTHKINGEPILVRYEIDVGGFRPDFFLPQYDIFIEHWGLNKDGEVPEWFGQSTQEYRDSIARATV